MENKWVKIFIGLFIVLVLFLIIFFIFKISFVKDSQDYLNDNGIICPAVCIELWEIDGGKCVFNECGSGCGEDGVNRFLNKDDCFEKLGI